MSRQDRNRGDCEKYMVGEAPPRRGGPGRTRVEEGMGKGTPQQDLRGLGEERPLLWKGYQVPGPPI